MTNVQYKGGKLLNNVDVVVVFLQATFSDGMRATFEDLNNPPFPPIRLSELDDFAYDIVDSAYMDSVGKEYSPAGKAPVGRGTYAGYYWVETTVNRPSSPTPPEFTLDDADVKKALDAAIQSGQLPPPGADTCYLVFTAAYEVTWNNRSSLARPPQGFDGYHETFKSSGGKQIYYGVVADLSTETTSHELVELITNPVSNGWIDTSTNPHDEVADLCQSAGYSFHGQQVSSFYSPSGNACVTVPDDNQFKPFAKAKIQIVAGGVWLGGVVVGEPVTLKATGFRNGRVDPLAQYQWQAQSVQITSATNEETFSIIAPPAPSKFQVDVSVVNNLGVAYVGNAIVDAISEEEAGRREHLWDVFQRIRALTPVNFNVDPLGDPLRDFNVMPVTMAEVVKLEALTNALSQFSTLARHTLFSGKKPADRVERSSSSPARDERVQEDGADQ